MNHLLAKQAADAANALTVDATADEVRDAKSMIDTFDRAWKQFKAVTDASFQTWIEQNGPIDIGETRYYVGPKSETVPTVDMEELVGVLLEHLTVEDMAKCIAKRGIKPGAARALLPQEVFDKCFERITRADVKEGVIGVNVKYLKGAGHESEHAGED